MATTAAAVREALAEAARTVLATAGPAVVRIGRHGGRAEQGSVTAADVDGDLVVVRVDTAGITPLVWAETPPAAGELVYAVARTPGDGTRITVGMLSSVDGAFRGPRGRRVSGSLEHTAPLARGSSGSPLLDEEGRLLGLNSARLGQGFYVALPADAELRARVDALLRGETPTRRVLGIGLAPAEVSARLRASVGLPPRPGLLVRSVDPSGLAAAAGVQVGDLVVGAAGTPVEGVDDLHRAIDTAGATLDVLVVRGADELGVTVTFPAASEEGETPA